jgi:NAD(P)-dependent dehydrogenase (short-subunit alcohol dehydrogenase family)
VTGASSGIGAATAQLLAREGADVALLARSEEGLSVVARRVQDEGARALTVAADVADREALERAVEHAAQRLGGLDVVVVSAAAAAFGTFRDMPIEDFDRCIAVAFGGAVDTIRAVLPHLERSAGRLVVIGSGADVVPLPLLSPYVAAKHALGGFLRVLDAELRATSSAVTVSEVRPGAVDTPFLRNLTHPDGVTPPLIPPLVSYRTEPVARAAVACAISPRRSITVGGAMLVLQLVNALARPLLDRGVTRIARYWLDRLTTDPAPNALWEPSGNGNLSGGQKGRPSVYAALRLARSRPGPGAVGPPRPTASAAPRGRRWRPARAVSGAVALRRSAPGRAGAVGVSERREPGAADRRAAGGIERLHR